MDNLSSRISSISSSIKQDPGVPVIYIAGPYRGDGTPPVQADNLLIAERTANQLFELGYGYFCPHSNGALSTYVQREYDGVEDFQTRKRHDINMDICRRIIMSCDAMLMLEKWEASEGAKEEHDLAKTLGVPIFYSVEDLNKNKHLFYSYPKQFNLLRSIQCIQYQLHREKNLDYSPYNVKATGSVGLVTRIWDKMARIMKLSGFDIGKGEFNKPIDPKNESLGDSFLDMSNYSLFTIIMGQGMWGE